MDLKRQTIELYGYAYAAARDIYKTDPVVATDRKNEKSENGFVKITLFMRILLF